MKYATRITLLLSFLLTILISNGQIITAFDQVEYYPDSVIKAVYRIKNEKFHGYSIEFDSTGTAIQLGKYKKGNKIGDWKLANGGSIYYDKYGYSMKTYPGCGTGMYLARKEFITYYLHLIHLD
jgi:hypothetical protein